MTNGIDERALDSLSVAPDGEQASNQERDPRQDAGQDAAINARLEANPGSTDARRASREYADRLAEGRSVAAGAWPGV